MLFLVIQCEVATRLGKRDRNRFTDPTACSRYERHTIVQFSHATFPKSLSRIAQKKKDGPDKESGPWVR
ncbi:MAG: hypothetical protein WAM58_02575, partial [Candidatus Acidiferrum sp.]